MLLLVKKLDADQGKIKIHLVRAVGDANSTVPETRRNLKDQVRSKYEATPHWGCPGSAPKTSRRPDDGA